MSEKMTRFCWSKTCVNKLGTSFNTLLWSPDRRFTRKLPRNFGAFMHQTILKIGENDSPQKRAKTPDFQGFLHGGPRRVPVNMGVRRRTLSQPSIFSLKSRLW
jgi:hypothetical protein